VSGADALLALLLLKTEFSLVALLGLFLLIGVVMKNAILMIDVALQRERETGATPEEAIREAYRRRRGRAGRVDDRCGDSGAAHLIAAWVPRRESCCRGLLASRPKGRSIRSLEVAIVPISWGKSLRFIVLIPRHRLPQFDFVSVGIENPREFPVLVGFRALQDIDAVSLQLRQ
jgi:hypothetical protein